MKKMLILGLCLFTQLSLANDKKENFDQMKSELSSSVDERINHLQEVKSCINSASDRAALKSCRQKMKEHRKEIRKKWKDKKRQRRSQQED